MTAPLPSLVKYTTPILIASADGSAQAKPTKNQPKDASKATEDILNGILPPREWTQGEQLWVQYVAPTPATRSDVVKLQEELDNQLLQRQARETGICPIREELYGQCFDELIRQVTIICAERGLLLLRVRDETRLTICAYQTLYESSIAFGMRKALQAEARKYSCSQHVKKLMNDTHELREQVDQLETLIVQKEEQETQKRQIEEERHRDEVEVLQKNNASLKEQLESLLSAPKGRGA